MVRKGRDLEVFTARLEKALGSTTADIESPGFLVDKVTGGQREFDIVIKDVLGPNSIIIAIECRDRISSQDVTWIEQLATKFKDCGVNKGIIVVSGKITKFALIKAEFNNIEVRRLKGINLKSLPKWYKKIKISLIEPGYIIERLTFTDAPIIDEDDFNSITKVFDKNNEVIHEDDNFEFSKKGIDAKIIKVSDTQSVITVKEFIDKAFFYNKVNFKKLRDALPSDVSDNSLIKSFFLIRNPGSKYQYKNNKGEFQSPKTIIVRVRICWKKKPAKFIKAKTYSSISGETISNNLSFDCDDTSVLLVVKEEQAK